MQVLQKQLPVKVFLENNSIAHTLTEKIYGIGKEFGSFMLLLVDTGIGAGITINEKLYKGKDGFGSEIGHTSVDINGEICSCGNRGCVELYASIPGLLKYANEYKKNIGSWKDIVDGALSGDRFCNELIAREASYLSACIVNTINVLELEAVVLAGDIAYKPELILKKIRDKTRESLINRNIHSIIVCISSISKDAEIVSAATIVFEKLFTGAIDNIV